MHFMCVSRYCVQKYKSFHVYAADNKKGKREKVNLN